jgi:hypothetical protein
MLWSSFVEEEKLIIEFCESMPPSSYFAELLREIHQSGIDSSSYLSVHNQKIAKREQQSIMQKQPGRHISHLLHTSKSAGNVNGNTSADRTKQKYIDKSENPITHFLD